MLSQSACSHPGFRTHPETAAHHRVRHHAPRAPGLLGPLRGRPPKALAVISPSLTNPGSSPLTVKYECPQLSLLIPITHYLRSRNAPSEDASRPSWSWTLDSLSACSKRFDRSCAGAHLERQERGGRQVGPVAPGAHAKDSPRRSTDRTENIRIARDRRRQGFAPDALLPT